MAFVAGKVIIAEINDAPADEYFVSKVSTQGDACFVNVYTGERAWVRASDVTLRGSVVGVQPTVATVTPYDRVCNAIASVLSMMPHLWAEHMQDRKYDRMQKKWNALSQKNYAISNGVQDDET